MSDDVEDPGQAEESQPASKWRALMDRVQTVRGEKATLPVTLAIALCVSSIMMTIAFLTWNQANLEKINGSIGGLSTRFETHSADTSLRLSRIEWDLAATRDRVNSAQYVTHDQLLEWIAVMRASNSGVTVPAPRFSQR